MKRSRTVVALLMAGMAIAAAVALHSGAADGGPVALPSNEAVALAQAQAAPEVQQEEELYEILPVKVYDLRPLLREVRHFEFAHLFQMEPPEEYPWTAAGHSIFDPMAAPETERDLRKEIRTVIERLARDGEPWETLGGRATIDFEEWRMIVTQTPAGHRSVDETLKMLLATRPQTLTISVRAVELKEALAEQVLGGRTRFATDDERRLLHEGTAQVHVAYLLTGLEGQTLSVNSGQPQVLIKEQEPVVAEAAVGFNTATHSVPNGLAVQVMARRETDDGQVALDYQLCYARLISVESVRVTAAVAVVADAVLHLPKTLANQQAGSITMPLGVPTVVAAATVPALLIDAKTGAHDKRQLFYVVTVNLAE